MDTDRTLTLIPYDARLLEPLKDLLPKGQDLGSLRRDLTDPARGHGRQVVLATRDGMACGVAGWVALGVETAGIVYGSPVLAHTEAAARLLLERLVQEARNHGAHQLRVSLLPGEIPKGEALRCAGFRALLDMIDVERSSRDLPAAALPAGLRPVPRERVDWDRFAAVYNRVFAEVPNAPPLEAEDKRDEWEDLDPDASGIWEDGAGCYVAWIAVHRDGHVDEVGVEESLRGQGVAPALYHSAGAIMAAKGVPRLQAMLASTNTATLRLHEKLGFRETARRTVFALDLASAGPEE